jgi:TetR/AcrR family transcriptional regulator, transcriptional repressor for nem operon
MNETAERLMDLAEARIREAGYRGLQLSRSCGRDRHQERQRPSPFPDQGRNGRCGRARYGDRFFELVARRHDESGDDVIAIYRSAFRSAIERDGRMCLNGVLGAEAGGLPPEVVAEIEMFFRRCIDDLSSRIGGADAVARAFHVMAALEGGLILARAYGDISVFDQATAGLTGPTFAVA